MIEMQHPTETLDALDCADCRLRAIIRLDQSIIDPLAVPFPSKGHITLIEYSPREIVE